MEIVKFKEVKAILNANKKEKLNDTQVRQVLNELEQFALMSVELFKTTEL